jgi:predicted AlkP superfamily pyrophosphatase or phosphodiesterase
LSKLLQLILASVVLSASAQSQPRRTLALISIDGLHPDLVLHADQHRLKIPNLRRYFRDGAHASAVRGVLPTVTYPSHTTIITGVWPAKHGIYSNQTFDALNKNLAGWYWYSEDIRVPTLWDAAARAGYVTGSVSWPVSVGAASIRYNIPEYWRAMTPDDIKLLRALSPPGMLKDYVNDLDIPGDRSRHRYSLELVRNQHVQFLTIHYAGYDHVAHAHGPHSSEAFAALEEIDRMAGEVENALRSEDRNAIVCIVSDHGFALTDHELNLNAAFVQAGLLTVDGKGAVVDWKAKPWNNSGSASIVLKDLKDNQTRAQVDQLLHRLASDPGNGIAQILDRDAIARLGGAPTVAFSVDMKTNFAIGSAMTGPLTAAVKPRGTHGFAPTHTELDASFFIAGPGIQNGLDLGSIDMRSIAPTLAKVLGIPFPTADLPALNVLVEARR